MAIAYVTGKVLSIEAKRANGQDLAELTLEVQKYGDNTFRLGVVAWGEHRNLVLDAVRKDDIVQVTAEPYTDEWPVNADIPDGPKNSKLALRLRDQAEAEASNPDTCFSLVKVDADPGINEVHLSGEVRFLGEVETLGAKPVRRAFVAVPLPRRDGTLSNWSFPIRLRAGFAEKATPETVGRGVSVSLVGTIENDFWKDKDGGANRYEGRVVVAAKGHKFAKA